MPKTKVLTIATRR